MDDKIYVKYGLLDGKVNVRSRYQWDHGVQINVTGMPTTNLAYIEFANEHMTESIRPESTIDEFGTMTCMIPDSLFMMPYPVIGYVILSDSDSMVTAMSIVIPVTPRAKPADYTCTPDEVIRFNDLVNKLNLSIQEVNELKKAVETATGNADAATQSANTAASKINSMTVNATTLAQGSDASVEKTDDGQKIGLTFGIPRGDTGLTPDITMNASTGEPGTDVTIVKSGTAEKPSFAVTIPRGDTGASGVYVGSDTPTDPEINVWIDPEGDADYDTVVSVNGVTADDEGNIQLSAGDVGALPSGGTATDASKLGGKSPDFYGHPLNWLHNSDFTNPINYRGLSSYTGQGYGIDRWYGRAVAQTVEVRSTDVTVTATKTSYVGILQKVGNFGKLAGKTVTLAARVYANVVPQILFVDGSGNALAERKGTAGSEQTLVLSYTLPTNTVSENVIPTILARTSAAGDYIRLYWAALYEGSYTADTIPTYVPKDRIVEMICCGVPLHQRNLLDNSDFRIKNNIINTKGLTDYSFDSGNVFDRWRLHWTGDGRVSIKDGYIELYRKTYSTYLFQHPKDLESMIGKTYTVAAKVRYNGYIGWIDSTQRVNSGFLALNDWDIATCTFTVGSATSDIGKAGIEIATKADLSFEVQWVALYEGAYTKETLPAYLTKGKHVEMLNCGVSLQPRNLLDNSNFTNPVNQRSFSSTTSTGESIGIDRWLFSVNSGGSISLTADGLVCQNANLIQRIESKLLDSSKGYTQVLWLADGTPVFPTKWVEFNYSSGIGRVVYYGITGTIAAAALYEGSYDASTLPAYQPKGYAAELAECMRYYKAINGIAGAYGTTINDQTGGYVTIDTGIAMHRTPSINLLSPLGWLRAGGVSYQVTELAINRYDGSMATLKVTCGNDTVPTGNVCVLINTDFELSADL